MKLRSRGFLRPEEVDIIVRDVCGLRQKMKTTLSAMLANTAIGHEPTTAIYRVFTSLETEPYPPPTAIGV